VGSDLRGHKIINSKSFCKDTHSFILRFWSEPRESGGATPLWRGEVEHVPTGKRIYFKNFDELEQFLAPYLPVMPSR